MAVIVRATPTQFSWEFGDGTAPLVTSVPGCFAVGDVRRGSVKRVASAVGEGSVVISSVPSVPVYSER